MKKRLLFFLVFLGMFYAGYFLSRPASAPAVPSPAPERAFLNAEWGMSKEQVVQANGTPLEKPSSARRFYEESPGMEGRYTTWEARQKFLGREATVSYTFADDQLFTYHVFTDDDDDEVLDSDMRRYLDRIFGPRSNQIEDVTSLKKIWQFKDKNVNYWIYEDETALRRKFKAGFGVVYKPVEQKLKSNAV